MWLFLVRSEHVKGKEAVSEEIGDFTTSCTSGSSEKKGGRKKKSLSLQSLDGVGEAA